MLGFQLGTSEHLLKNVAEISLKNESLRIIYVVGAVAVISFVLLASFLLASQLPVLDDDSLQSIIQLPDAPVYVGVTYSGSNLTEARMLIDKVKNCTNLFVLQSGTLETNISATNTICRYAVDSGLHFIVYFSAVPTYQKYVTAFLSTVDVWGSNLLGIYFDDEPGGKMLDAPDINMYDNTTHSIIRKNSTLIEVTQDNGNQIVYANNGLVEIHTADYYATYNSDGTIQLKVDKLGRNPAEYLIQPNKTVFLLDDNGNVNGQLNDTSILPQIESYQQIMVKKPFQNYDETEQIFVGTIQNSTGWLHDQTYLKAFTSDYALYWYDYKGGFDVVLAELGWNHTTAQDIALARGAANLQGKDWGAIVTWKYNYPERVNFPDRQYGPYLGSGDEMYDQLRQAYEAGAKYLVIFNYPTYPNNNPYGVLQDDHFLALQQFWSDTVQNKTVIHGGNKAETALVLPRNYGWGMRNPQDNIWGLWQADDSSKQVWMALQDALVNKGAKLDIIYDDPAYPFVGRYMQLLYWNQTR